jgi:peptidoglycan/LPS O-acetylase OafA/YrhL
MKLQTLHTLQAGRGLAALAVVFFHAGVEVGRDPRFWLASSYDRFLAPGELGVEFFFVLSGIVIVLAHWRDIGNASSLPLYAWKRFRRIYPIYWVVLAAAVPALFIFPHLQPGVDRSLLSILSSIILVHLGSLGSVLIVGWTLFHEILFYSIFALMLLNRSAGLLAMTAWLGGSVINLLHVIESPGLAWFFSPLHLLFGAGMLIAFIVKGYPALDWRLFLLPGAAGLGTVLVWSYQVHHRTDAISLAMGASLAFLVLGLIELERNERLIVWPPLNFLGDASYSIYLLHFPILSFVFRALFAASRSVPLPLWIWTILGVAIAVTAGIATHIWVEMPLLKLLSRYGAQRSESAGAAA